MEDYIYISTNLKISIGVVMMTEHLIKIFGSDPPCPKCKATERAALEAVKELKLNAKVEHKSALSDEAERYGIFSTPAVVVNEKVIFSGRVPSKGEFVSILAKEFGVKP